jgi:hypothetical protein
MKKTRLETVLEIDEMRLVLIFSAVIFMRVLAAKKCPFPGIPANTVALNERNEVINWQNRPHFIERQIVKYFCVGLDNAIVKFASELSCKDDGQWNNSLPRCGKQLSIES